MFSVTTWSALFLHYNPNSKSAKVKIRSKRLPVLYTLLLSVPRMVSANTKGGGKRYNHRTDQKVLINLSNLLIHIQTGPDILPTIIKS